MYDRARDKSLNKLDVERRHHVVKLPENMQYLLKVGQRYRRWYESCDKAENCASLFVMQARLQTQDICSHLKEVTLPPRHGKLAY